MSDNYKGKTIATGVEFASEEIGGVQHPKMKMEIGAAGVAIDLAPGQDDMAGSIPVVIANDQSAIPISGDVGLTGVTFGSGNTDSTTLRVITAADGPLNTAIGAPTDAPASSVAVEDTTSRTHTALLKGIKNILLAQTGSTTGIGGELTDAPASNSAPEDTTARTEISLLKGIKNVLLATTGSEGGATTDAAASSSVAEDTTARTSISLSKGIKNVLLLLNTLTRGSGAVDANTLRVVTSTDGPMNVAIGTTADAAASSTAAEDTTARTHTALLKGVKNILASMGINATGTNKVGGNTTTVTVTPTLTTHASYIANDFVGTDATCMTIAAGRINDGSGVIQSAMLIDYAAQSIVTELWLFDASVTPPNDSAAWTITDADALKCIGVIKFDTYFASAANSVAMGNFQPIAFKCASGTKNIFGCLVTRGAPAYASGDVSVRLTVLQD